jgi:hypothetical protein
MKNKKYWVLAAILLICASVIWAVDKTEAQTSPQVTFIVDQRDTLKELQGIGVAVENFNVPEVEKHGLTRQKLQTDVELRLRQHGIRVLSEKELFTTPGMPYLYVDVAFYIHSEIPLNSEYIISVKLKQRVFLARDLTKSCTASTWDKGGTLGIVGLDKVETTIRENVKDLVDEFINDYLAANPKREPKSEHR